MLPVKKPTFVGSLFTGSGVTTALLAKLACPVCYPAAAGIISSAGLGVVINQTYMDVASVILIPAALFGLGFRARQRRGYGPLVLGLISVAIGLVGKVTGLNFVFFTGVGGLVAAAVWNLLPKRSCSACATGQDSQNLTAQGKELAMGAKRKIEVFSAGCPTCDETIKLVRDNACSSCEVDILDVKKAEVQSRMKSLGIKSIPAVAIDGKLAGCCAGRGPNLADLKAAGLGKA